METIKISSQRYIDENIVNEKIANEDFEVMLSPIFEIEGVEYQVILDGHHSFKAAIESGNRPEFWTADCSDDDAIYLLEEGKIDDFLVCRHNGNDYYNFETGKDIW